MNMTDKHKRYINVLKNKYFITFVIFLIWMLIFDQNNFIDRYKYKKEIGQLTEDKAYYLHQIEEDSRRLHELKTNNENLEKFAREQYLMKRKNEDVFIVVDEGD